MDKVKNDVPTNDTVALKKIKKLKAISTIKSYEKTNWMSVLILFKINLKRIIIRPAFLSLSILFLTFNIVFITSMYISQSINGGVMDFNVFSLLMTIQYLVGSLLLSFLLISVLIYLIKVQKINGMQNIEVRAGIKPFISHFIRVAIGFIIVAVILIANLLINVLLPLGLTMPKTGYLLIVNCAAFWMLYAFVFSSISLIVVQLLSFANSLIFTTVITILFSFSPTFSMLLRYTPSIDAKMNEAKVLNRIEPFINSGQDFYNALKATNTQETNDLLTGDNSLFTTLQKNIGEVFFPIDDNVTIGFQDFADVYASYWLEDGADLLQFMVQTGNYNAKLTSYSTHANGDSMNNYLFKNTKIYNLLERIRIDLIGYEDTSVNPFIGELQNGTTFKRNDIISATNYIVAKDPGLEPLMSEINRQYKKMSTYNKFLPLEEQNYYENPQFVATGGSYLPTYKYEQNSEYFDIEYENELSPVMQEIAYITLQLYKNMYFVTGSEIINFNLNNYITNNTLDTSMPSFKILNILNPLNHFTYIYLNGAIDPFAANALDNTFSFMNKFNLYSYDIQLSGSLLQQYENNKTTGIIKLNSASLDKIVFEEGNEVTYNKNVYVTVLIFIYLFLGIGFYALSFRIYILNARY